MLTSLTNPVIKQSPRFGSQPAQNHRARVEAQLANLSYKKGFEFVTYQDRQRNVSAQVQFPAADVEKPGSEPVLRTGARKWPIPANYNEGQVVQTIFMALKAVEEHEQRETFYYKGQKVFNPHFNIGELSNYLQANGIGEPEPPITTNLGFISVLNDCAYQNYRFQLVNFTPIPNTDKVTLTVELQKNQASTYQPVEDMTGKRITFVTTNKPTPMVRNLMDAVIEESMKELRFSFKHKGIPLYSNEVSVDRLVDFSRKMGTPGVHFGSSDEETPQAEPTAEATPTTDPQQEKLLRLAADFQNFRKRAEREKAELRTTVTGEVITSLLTPLDHIRLALANLTPDSDPTLLLATLQNIGTELNDWLKAQGVETVGNPGDEFDPNLHQALAYQEHDEHPDQTIAETYSPGFTLGDTLLRPAQVVVSKGKGLDTQA